MEIGHETERALQVALDDLVVQFECVEALFDPREFGADLGLLGFEYVDRDRGGVVRFEELAALVECLALACDKLLPLDSSVLPKAGDLFEDVLFGLSADVLAELDVLVVVLDPAFNDVDEESALTAAGLVALPADANEVGIDRLAAAGCVTDNESAAALVSVLVSPAAEQRALEVVVVGALLLTGEVLRLELALYLVKRGLVDQGRVFPVVLDTHVAHYTDVSRGSSACC